MLIVGDGRWTVEDLTGVARNRVRVALADGVMDRVVESRRLVEQWVADGRTVYGVTTGFGALCKVAISGDKIGQLQQNILMSHAAGVGPALSEEVVRGTMAVRLRDLAMGYAGIRPQTIDTLTAMLNADVYPYVPEKGSVGASGDLAPMSHLALVMIGLGEAFVDGRRVDGGTALDRAGLAPISLEAGEGLALINGTQVMAAMAALAVYDLTRLVKTADVACAMSLETLMGSNAEFNPLIHRVRPHPGQTTAADNMARITADSEIISSHKDCDRVQDAYTLRCSPQIHGASRQALNHVREVVTTEINSSTTNPLVIAETGEILFGGNFHGQPLALGADYLCMAAAELANVSERRIERLVNPNLSGLPAFLVRDSGLNSGFMIPQYTAAALVSENKVLAHPACVDSIPTSANKEDHVSMGAISVRKLRSIIDNLEYVLAIELLCGAQAVDLLTQGKPGRGTVKAYEAVREAVPSLDCDRIMSADLERARDLVRSGELVDLVESAVGPLG